MEQSVASVKPRRGFKEFVRKFFVSLKRNPHFIAMFVMLVTYVFYSLNLTKISNATAYIYGDNMGQCEFVAMLLGILSLVTFLRAFPRREKPKLIMIGLTALLLAGTVFTEFVYASRITEIMNDHKRMYDEAGNLRDAGKAAFAAQPVVNVHIILLIVSIALIVLLPIYSKALRMINTSIDVAGNENMATIDMASEDE